MAVFAFRRGRRTRTHNRHTGLVRIVGTVKGGCRGLLIDDPALDHPIDVPQHIDVELRVPPYHDHVGQLSWFDRLASPLLEAGESEGLIEG